MNISGATNYENSRLIVSYKTQRAIKDKKERDQVQASIYIHKRTKDKYRVPGNFSKEARKIYKAFNLERSLDGIIYQP